ncbi:2-dehydro-3-deoxygalactonokinase [Marinobacterium rhizophilum]|uniref:2-dehydro-3-deoxygalactonokinase n=1 Tax=Marinobacterium rhizophilum TaxID=420402 RepID=A0ABY5HED0_9GAMM|nr:2-dehydro-3-deoxygalactonokinase [Marinobacterium rhizophilum]UTW10711.1 2-dehydro-3-deoxygalactonokinase [Marinobacterium rhizophilum]
MNSTDSNSIEHPADWIAVDWGTSRMRAWAMTAAGTVLASTSSDKGMGSLAPHQFEATLLDAVGPWLRQDHRTPVVACGMVGARQGWMEAPYQAVPCAPAAELMAVPVADARLSVQLCPGLKQLSPADVMRGEETQVAGLLATRPGFDGVVCLPGTHSKWVRLQGGQVTAFQTFMTGELYALLAGQSVLSHSVGGQGWDDEAFAGAIDLALENPAAISARLFSLRAEALLADLAPATARARLSGYVIGLELAAARAYWDGQPVAIIGATTLGLHYGAALEQLGAQSDIHDGEALTLRGLHAAYQQTTGA